MSWTEAELAECAALVGRPFVLNIASGSDEMQEAMRGTITAASLDDDAINLVIDDHMRITVPLSGRGSVTL